MSFLNAIYKMFESLSGLSVIVLKHQETLEPYSDQRGQVLVKAAVGHALGRIWSLACERIDPCPECISPAPQNTLQYTHSFGETCQINREIRVFIIKTQIVFVFYSVFHH